MPRYYFHLYHRFVSTEYEDGQVLADENEALETARRMAREITEDLLSKGEDLGAGGIEVVDEGGAFVTTLAFQDTTN